MDKIKQSATWGKLFGESSSSTVAAPSAKRVAVVASDATLKQIQQRADVALKLATIVTQKQRDDEAALSSSLPLKRASQLFQAMGIAHAEYLKLAKGNKGHGLGDGSTFRFAALLVVLAESDKVSKNDKIKFTKALEAFDPKARSSLRAIKWCKTEGMYASDTVRFKLSIPSDTVMENAVVDAMEAIEGSTQWIGPRPAGYLEAEAQKILSGTA